MSLLTSAATVQRLSSRNRFSQKSLRALTLLEILVVCAVLGVLAVMLLPAVVRTKQHNQRVQCVNNLMQIGMAFRVWESNGDKYPMATPEANGGTMEYVTGTNAWRHFQVMSNELISPKILICPADTDRFPATNFIRLNNSNLSYFVGIDATETIPAALLSGDGSLTNGTPVKNGILELTTATPAGWTAAMHKKVGDLCLADGSMQQVSIAGLQNVLASTGFATNRLQMPVLTP